MLKGWLTKISSGVLAAGSIAMTVPALAPHMGLIQALMGLAAAGSVYGIRRNMPNKV